MSVLTQPPTMGDVLKYELNPNFMGAALQLGAALGLSPLIIAELLPPIEAVMVRKSNEEIEHRHG